MTDSLTKRIADEMSGHATPMLKFVDRLAEQCRGPAGGPPPVENKPQRRVVNHLANPSEYAASAGANNARARAEGARDAGRTPKPLAQRMIEQDAKDKGYPLLSGTAGPAGAALKPGQVMSPCGIPVPAAKSDGWDKLYAAAQSIDFTADGGLLFDCGGAPVYVHRDSAEQVLTGVILRATDGPGRLDFSATDPEAVKDSQVAARIAAGFTARRILTEGAASK